MATAVEAPPSPKVPRRARDTLARRDARAGLLLVSPTLVIVLVLVILPVIWTILLAFQRVRLSGIRQVDLLTGPYVTRNFDRILGGTEFWTVLKTTLLYTIGGSAGSIVLGLIAALLVRSKFRGRTLVRAAMLLPWVAPIVAVAFTWQVLLSPQFGFVNSIGESVLGWSEPVPFLSQESTALWTVIAFESWRYFPFAFLFILARLQALPSDLEEAALMDGATPSQTFRHIILPQLAGVIALLCVLRFIWTLNKFDDVYLLTNGGAGTKVLAVQVFDFLTARNDVGASAAVGVIMAAIMSVFLLVYLRFFAGKEEA
jgi:multiple sugar transport system permease protein